MDEEAYARHIIQKRRLAVAIAVIKNKPTNVSVDAYIQDIRDKLKPIIVIDDEEVSICSENVCSEDFDTWNEEDDTNLDTLPNEQIADSIFNDNSKQVMKDSVKNKCNFDNMSKKPIADAIVSGNTIEVTKNNADTSNFDTLPIDIEEYIIESAPHEPIKGITRNTKKYINTLTNYTENCEASNNRIEPEAFYMLNEDLEKDMPAININKNTETIEEVSKDLFLANEQYEINENLIDLDRTMTINEDESDKEELNDSMNILEGLDEKRDNSNVPEVLSEVFSLIRNADLNIEKEINSQRTYCESQAENPKSSKLTNQFQESTTANDSQNTIFYTIEPLTDTHYSQSQTQNIVVQQHFIKNNKNLPHKRPSFNLDNVAITNNTNTNSNDAVNMEIVKNNTINNNTLLNNRKNINAKKDSEIERLSNEDVQNYDNEVFSDDEPSTSQKVLPFKIIEEMNKIKLTLNKRHRRMSTDGHSTDSGYRSDSQKSLRNSLHISENWLNQSGCSLLRHLIQCSLNNSTQDINDEISQVLGNLIDSLHADEKYPTFLEEILDNIEKILKDLHEEPNDGDSPLQKEENLHRLILLNKSVHTQKYTISKITCILENTYLQLTQTDSIYEITNIDKIENLTYIFHLLSIIIKTYLRNKPSSSQMTESSQLTDSKRSTIAEVWRRKWHPIQETINFSDDSVNTCILSKCRVVLNKIVVDCMEGYSLISYTALECFNLLQN